MQRICNGNNIGIMHVQQAKSVLFIYARYRFVTVTTTPINLHTTNLQQQIHFETIQYHC